MNIHDLAFANCPLLGPALYIWVQGCPRRCRGCFNSAALDRDLTAKCLKASDLAGLCLELGGGLVLSGGEPFLQAQGLTEVCRLLRKERPETPILLYTGYTLEELLHPDGGHKHELLNQADALVDGPFDIERLSNDPLMGSDNQRLFFLTSRIHPDGMHGVRTPEVQVIHSVGGWVRIMGTGRSDMDMNDLLNRARAQGVELWEDR